MMAAGFGSAIEDPDAPGALHEAKGDHDPGSSRWGARASLAEPEGYVRTFIDEGAPMARLLTEARARGAMPDYAGRLLAALDAGTAAAVPPPNAAQALAGLLT